MANLKSLVKDTAIYGLSSIVGRFLNYLMVPLYTYTLKSCADYGIYNDIYAQTALLMVLLTFGMETTFFRFMNKEEGDKMRVYSTALMMVGGVCLTFAGTAVYQPHRQCARLSQPQVVRRYDVCNRGSGCLPGHPLCLSALQASPH